ncbi:MAG: hypothetical protein ABI885_30635 [Gammaproteobacteria bacterium]
MRHEARRPDEALLTGGDWIFEPKWDGFRALIFRDGREIFIQSRDAKPLARYYTGLPEPLRKQLPKKCVLDGALSSLKAWSSIARTRAERGYTAVRVHWTWIQPHSSRKVPDSVVRGQLLAGAYPS